MTTPVIVDLAPVRCPAPDPRVSAEWRKVTPRPQPKLCEESGKTGVCKDQVREWINALEESEVRKNVTGKAQEKDNAACRGDDGKKPVS